MKRILLYLLLLLLNFPSFSQDGILSINGNLLIDTSGNFINYFPVTRQNLEAKFDTIYKTESGDLINLAGGTNAVYVSGTGLDAIYDFSGLNDLRLNKNAYLGNSFSLPEYYNYPYVDIYFDTNHPYYWKLKDFHYANFLSQSLTVDNIAFLKAKATTNTSNVIASVSELFIYSNALTSTNLSKIKTYIGIQNDFYGDELMTNPDFNLFFDWTLQYGSPNVSITDGILSFYDDELAGYFKPNILPTNGLLYGCDIKYKSDKIWRIVFGGLNFNIPISGDFIKYSFESLAEGPEFDIFYLRIINIPNQIYIDYINVYIIYRNYYKS